MRCSNPVSQRRGREIGRPAPSSDAAVARPLNFAEPRQGDSSSPTTTATVPPICEDFDLRCFSAKQDVHWHELYPWPPRGRVVSVSEQWFLSCGRERDAIESCGSEGIGSGLPPGCAHPTATA